MKNKYTSEALDNTAKELTFGQDLKKDFREMYDLGYKHGFEMGLKEAELRAIQVEIDKLGEKHE